MTAKMTLVAVGWAVLMASPLLCAAQQSAASHTHASAPDATVDFGVLATAPLGPPPCAQTPPYGGPADPCGFKIHHLTPEEVTILKGGQVTFQVHGGGHAMAIHEVSKKTSRDDIGQYLCPGVDVTTVEDPADHPCLASAANAAAGRVITDGKGDEVIVVAPNVTNQFPDNRIWSPPTMLMSAGAHQFLNGGTIPAGPTSNGQLVTYRFLKTGRYLVICANRGHLLNDWMFGFVNVVGD